MKEQKEIKEMNQTQKHPWSVNNILFHYEEETYSVKDSEKKLHILQHKEKHSNNKEAYKDGSKSTGK